jgi:hypothetical protein
LLFGGRRSTLCCVALAKLLLCKQIRCSGIWYTLSHSQHAGTVVAAPHNLRVKMSDIATTALPASETLFARLVGKIDRLVMAWAEANIRNGDVPHVGL